MAERSPFTYRFASQWDGPRHHPMPPDGAETKFGKIPSAKTRETSPRLLREPLTDQRRDELLAGLFNSESKMIVLGGMAMDPRVYTSGDLDQMIRWMQRGQKGWDISTGVPHKYCSESLSDISLVVTDEIQGDRTTLGYRPTDDGVAILPVIGHLLRLSEKYKEFSLHKVLSVTSTPRGAGMLPSDVEKEDIIDAKVRAPKIRYRLFKALLNADGPVRGIDLRRAIDSNNFLDIHLDNLKNAGIISYDAPAAGDRELVTFSPVDGLPKKITEVPPSIDSPKLDKRITLVVSSLSGTLSTLSVYDQLIKLFPEYKKRTTSYVKSNISVRMNHLAREGYLSKHGRTKDTLSQASLTAEQRERLEEFVTVIDQLQTGDPAFLAEGEQLAREILSDPKRVASLMRKAEKNSIIASSLGKDVLKERIQAIVDSTDGVINGPQVAIALGHIIGKSYATALLRELAGEGSIKLQKRDQAVWYTSVQETTAVHALPEDRSGLEAVAHELRGTMESHKKEIGMLWEAYKTHSDPLSEDASTIMLRIQELRDDPTYIAVTAHYEAVQERLEMLTSVEEAEDANLHSVKTRKPDEKTIETRARIDAFRELGISDPGEIAEWMGIPQKYVYRHILVMDDMLDRAISPERMERINKARDLRDRQGLDVQQIADEMQMDKSTIYTYLRLADDTERLANQRELSPRESRKVQVRELEEELSAMMGVDAMVTEIAKRLHIARGTVYGYREELHNIQANKDARIKHRRENFLLLEEAYADMPAGERTERIARELGVSIGTVYADRTELIAPGAKRASQIADRRLRIKHLYDQRPEGVTAENWAEYIAAQEGVSPSTVFIDLRWLRKNHPPLRSAKTAEEPQSEAPETTVFRAGDHIGNATPDLDSTIDSLGTLSAQVDWSGEEDLGQNSPGRTL